MKAKDLREKSTEDLNELLKTSAKAVFETRFKNFTNRLDDTSAIRKSRRELARIYTILGERARAAAPAAKAEKPAVEATASEKPAKAKAAPKAAKSTPSVKTAAAKADKPAKKTTKKEAK
jgi:large subunit ribosomal protein L29